TAIQVNAQSSPTSCSNTQNGTITLLASGGSGPYLYSINGGTPNSTGVFNGLSAGNYTYLVTGANMCNATGSITVSSPSALNIQVNGNPVSCFGGSNGTINVSGSGGTPPYSYALNGGNFGSNGTFTGLAAGTYNLIV